MLPVVVTMGEPSGVGPELIIKSWHMRCNQIGNGEEVVPFFVLGDPELFKRRARDIASNIGIYVCDPREAKSVFSFGLPVVSFDYSVDGVPGSPSVADAYTVIKIIDKAVELVKANLASAMVTSPISKFDLRSVGFKWSGHTYYLAYLADKMSTRDRSWVECPNETVFISEFMPVMFLLNSMLRIATVTGHVSVKEVSQLLTEDLIVNVAHVVVQSLMNFWGIERPRLAVLGLNPHAGEQGILGLEEKNTIVPAVLRLIADGIQVTGPHSADSMFHKDRRCEYDAVLAMYHDQALIPVKTLSFYETVNVTLGLPFVRTSPAHGTSLGIAGRGLARADSFIAAIRLAGSMARKQSNCLGRD